MLDRGYVIGWDKDSEADQGVVRLTEERVSEGERRLDQDVWP